MRWTDTILNFDLVTTTNATSVAPGWPAGIDTQARIVDGSHAKAGVGIVARHDLVVVGMGVGGLEVAVRAAAQGLNVLGIEEGLVGGECPYWGCVPSKAMTRAAEALGDVGRVSALAGRATIDANWAILAGRVREVSDAWDDTKTVERLRSAGVTLRRGRARIVGPGEVEVDGERIIARRGLVIASGTRPVIPPVSGLSQVAYWTNRDAIETGAAPRSLAVLGGGAVGLELAQVFCRFGSAVTIIEAADHVLPMEEPENATAIAEVLRHDAITVRTGVTASAVSADGAGVRVSLSDGTSLAAERLLVATGRRPDLAALGVAKVGLDEHADHVPTDARLRVGDGVWAVGDVTGRGQFTHVAYYQAQIAAADITGQACEPADYTAVPRVTYTDPEIASVGLTEARARQRGLRVRVGRLPTSGSDRGWLYGAGADLGVTKVIEDAATGRLVGGSSLGPAAGETIALLGVAIRARIPVSTLMEVIFPYPTFARAIRGALRRLA